MKHTMLVFDFETSGVDIEQDRILTCYIKTNTGFEQSWTINPGVEVPEGASDVHGMTTEWIQEHGDPDAKKCVSEILEVLREYADHGYIMSGFNHSFDFGMLHFEALRYDLPTLNREGMIVIDPIIIDRKIDKYRKGGRKLMDVARHYGIKVDETRLHEAKYDVIVTEQLVPKVLNAAVREEKDLAGLPASKVLDKLQVLQALWKKEWASGLTWYFEKQGKKEEDGSKIVVDSSFPWKGAV